VESDYRNKEEVREEYIIFIAIGMVLFPIQSHAVPAADRHGHLMKSEIRKHIGSGIGVLLEHSPLGAIQVLVRKRWLGNAHFGNVS
jgi:hypothetical protein